MMNAKTEEIETLKSSFSNLQVELSDFQFEYIQLSREFNDLQNDLREREAQLEELRRQRDDLTPKISFNELKEWLRIDRTDKDRFSLSTDYIEFAARLIESGEENGWDMAYVNLEFSFKGEENSYGLCAIELSDRGEVWIIPWKDVVIEPCQVGDELPFTIHEGEYYGAEIVDITVVY